MSRLEIRLLGGFDARLDGVSVSAFESQKARALLAYLALKGEQPVAREALADLLWSEREPTSARRNLRQALHNVRGALAGGESSPALLADNQSVRLNPDIECWVDSREFERAIRRGISERGPDPHQLATAARLYAGDFLAGFFVKESPVFEEWLVTEQERLREEALEAYRVLISAYLSRGEFRYGIQYSRRLLAIDPLSEECHRQLMKLYSLAGRRHRALAQYERLRNQLNSELGVEPLDETTEVYRAILADELPQEELGGDDERGGPLIPLVGRAEALAKLDESWRAVRRNRGRLTLVRGVAGAGKSRLIKSFVDGATSRHRTVVLSSRSYLETPLVGFQIFAELLVGAFADILPDEPEVLEALSADVVSDLALIAPVLPRILAESDVAQPDPERIRPDRVHESMLELLRLVCTRWTPGSLVPVILLLDDVQWADRASLDLLQRVTEGIDELPIWILASMRTEAAVPPHPILDSTPAAGADVVPVDRLEIPAVDEIAQALLDPESAPTLAAFLWEHSGGLPLAVAELVNLLWDEKVLVASGADRWSLVEDPAAVLSPPSDISDLINLRIARLPASARRLLAMAGVAGQRFDAALIGAACDEHLRVTEICIELMLERWLIRQFPRSWSQAGRQSDVVLWARGARRGWFEFGHTAMRVALLESINPLRKRLMHRDLARALRREHEGDLDQICEPLAFHALEAGEWADALPPLELALERSLESGAWDVAEWYQSRAVQVAERLISGARSDADKAEFEKRRERLLEVDLGVASRERS